MIYVLKLSNKKGATMAQQLDLFFDSHFAPALIGSDMGTEMWNKDCDKIFKKYRTTLYALREPNKAALAENSIRYIKRKIYQYITYRSENDMKPAVRYIDKIDEIVKGLNSSVNAKTGFAPKDITFANQHIVVAKTYGSKLYDYLRPVKFPTLKPDTEVKISTLRHPFSKSYKGTWTKETFLIDEVHCK